MSGKYVTIYLSTLKRIEYEMLAASQGMKLASYLRMRLEQQDALMADGLGEMSVRVDELISEMRRLQSTVNARQAAVVGQQQVVGSNTSSDNPVLLAAVLEVLLIMRTSAPESKSRDAQNLLDMQGIEFVNLAKVSQSKK